MKKLLYRWQKNCLILDLYVQTRASRNVFIGMHGDKLKVAITSPPIENKANKHLIKFLSIYFGVSQNQIKIIKGNNSRHKSILILNPQTHLDEFKD